MARASEPVRRPLPRGAKPAKVGGEDVLVYVAEGRDAEAEYEDILIRKSASDIAAQFRAAAGARQWTYGEYLGALVRLHASMRGLAADDKAVAQALERLGLSPVTI